MRNTLIYAIGLILLLFSCGTAVTTSTASIEPEEIEERKFPDLYYDSCNLHNFPYQYSYSLIEPGLANVQRKLKIPLDSVLSLWIAGPIGMRFPKDSIWDNSALYIEDINKCHKTGFFQVPISHGRKLDKRINFKNFPELRYVDINWDVTITNEQMNDLLRTAKNLKGLTFKTSYDIPECICELDKLEYLEIFNGGRYNIPSCIADLPNLKMLRISGVKPEMASFLFKNPNLEYLAITGGEKLLIPESIGSMKRLKHLRLSHLKGFTLPDNFTMLDSLELLEFDWIISDTLNINKQLSGLNNLKGVKMSRVRLTDLPRFEGCNKLEFLRLSYLDYVANPTVDISAYASSLMYFELRGGDFRKNTSFPTGLREAKNLEYFYDLHSSVRELPNWLLELTKLKALGLPNAQLNFKSLKFAYGPLYKGGMRYFRPNHISGMTEEQKSELNQINNNKYVPLGGARPKRPYNFAFIYYEKKIKYDETPEWTQ